MKTIIAGALLLFLAVYTSKAQDFKNIQFGLPDLNQVAPIAKSTGDALPFAGLDIKATGNPFTDTLAYFLSIANGGFKPAENVIAGGHYLRASSVYGPDINARDRVIFLRFVYDAPNFKQSAVA